MKRHLYTLFAPLALLLPAPLLAADPSPAANLPFQNPSLPLEQRVNDLAARLTLDEKIALLHGDSKFTTAALPRFGIPRRWMSDGPQGVREDIGPDTWKPAGRTDDFATALPANIGLAATFDPSLARAYGNVIGEEAATRGKNIMLGPGVNIMRTPLNGRNSEYLGEDPFLAGRMAVAYIDAVQSHGVASCVKHFTANNQETDRNAVDVEVDDRALHEIYLPAFKAAVTEGHVWCVMTAYNQLRGHFCSENDLLLNQILKGDWHFPGLVMSDWAGTHSTLPAATHGLDLEMGTDKPYNQFYFADPLKEAVEKHALSEDRLNDMVRRNLRVMCATGMFDPPAHKLKIPLMAPAHLEAARRIEEAAIVLLKNNDHLLPLDAHKIRKIAIIGDLATEKFAHYGNSAAIKTTHEVTPLEGIQKFLAAAGNNAQVTYAPGYPPLSKNARNALHEDQLDPRLIDDAVAAAKNADAVIILAGLYRWLDEEGIDRTNITLPKGQNELIQKLAAANPRTLVVLTGGGPIAMDPWLQNVPAVLQYWYGGTEGGNALANILFGKANPSGKLPCTLPRTLADSPAHANNDPAQYPGVDKKEQYKEGLLVGYRWFDAKNIQPLFPFGFGLSYTTFACSDLAVTPAAPVHLHVTALLQNTGTVPGAEVLQLYIHPHHPSVPRPPQELKGFTKVFLQPGEIQRVSIDLTPASFAYWSADKNGWLAEKGDYTLDVGTSSRDLPLHADYTLPRNIFIPDSQ